MTDARDRIIGPLRDKLPDVTVENIDDAAWEGTKTDRTEEFKLEIHVDEEARVEVVNELLKSGIPVGTAYGSTIKTRATAEEVFEIASTDNVRKVFEELPTALHATSEGVEISNADVVQDTGVTGDGVKTAIIDLDPDAGGGFWPETHTKYGDNVVDTIQSGDPDEESYFIEESEMHGTGCTEIVYDMAPDSDLVLLAFDGNDADGDIVSMLEKIEKHHPDTAVVSISLGSAPTDRLDGQDDVSEQIEKFTTEGETITGEDGPDVNRGRICAISAGNEADGNVWHGQFTDSGDGTMEFESGEDYLEIQNAEAGTAVIANWDSWDEGDQEYSVTLYEDDSKSSELDSASAASDFVFIQIPGEANGETVYFEIEQESASRDHEFDVWLWGNLNMEITESKSSRSISIPATTRDDHTLTTAAIQATDFGAETSAGDLKRYSSQGPTRDGRDGIEIAAPSRVSQTEEGYGTASSDQDPSFGFNGTSAAAPHVAGAATQLFQLDGVDYEDIAAAIKNTGMEIPDDDVDKDDTTIVGGGYLDVEAAYDELLAEETTVEVSLPDSIAQGESATLEIDATLVDSVTVEKLWTDWSVDWDMEDGDVQDDVESLGELTFSWDTTQNSATLTPTITPNGDVSPDPKYVSGAFRLDITATGPEETIQDSVILKIDD